MHVYHGIRLIEPKKLEKGIKLWDARRCREEVSRAFNYFANKGFINLDNSEVKNRKERALVECDERFEKKGIHATFLNEAACGWAMRNPEITWIWLATIIDREGNQVIPDEEISKYLENRYGHPYSLTIDLDRINVNHKTLSKAVGKADVFIPMDELNSNIVSDIKRC